MTKFVGRKSQLLSLKQLRQNQGASLAVLRGRRRIGKTRLAEEFSKLFDAKYYFTGLAPEQGITQTEQRKAQSIQDIVQKLALRDWSQVLTEVDDSLAMPTKALEPACDVCQDMGFVRKILPPHHPQFGKLFECPATCEAVQNNAAHRSQVMIDELAKKAGHNHGLYLSHPYDRNEDLTIPSIYHIFQDSHSQKTAYSIVRQILVSLRETGEVALHHDNLVKHSLVLYGDKGYGKTLLASALVNSLVEHHIPAFGARLSYIIKRINDVYQETNPQYTASQILYAFASFPVLVIDEFEMNNITASRADIVEELINARYVRKLPTILTTNLDQAGISKKWSGRVADRIIDSFWFYKVAGEKLRHTSSEIQI